ncbi:acyltransferase family protein [Rufibacter latericius]|uniref:Acyltransferase n=1 Tax=Rufibacter latericius TaxID=2487040 RepID=A0A3M9N2Q8_9BACT|nr:acyltransferase [Rufibacter latericius]RNI31617.1 acyltransferase [Rufibacter latericius]
MGYIKQLDSLRAIAIFFVLCNHWLPEGNVLQSFSRVISAPDIFFTISGFLITMILLKDRRKAEANQTSKALAFKDFFLKRSLRIFPAYYLTILVTYVLKPHAVSNYSSYLSFTANFDMYAQKYWGNLTHLWSMSVEQQFYLFWPLLILFTPRRFLPYTILLFISIGIISQNTIPNREFLWVLPQTCFDALGIGALLAWVVVEKNSAFPWFHVALRFLGILSILVIAGQYIWGEIPVIHHRTLVSIIIAWLIAFFISEGNESANRVNLLFQNKALLLIGKMSYGIYLYHLTLYLQSRRPLGILNQSLPLPQFIRENHYLFVAENLILLFALAWLSWKFFELPVSNLKRHLKKEKTISVVRQTA